VNGLRSESRLRVDKVTTIPKGKLGERVGRLGDEDLDGWFQGVSGRRG
jgi:mRNA interferase MazF